jgi:hypothetical protein
MGLLRLYQISQSPNERERETQKKKRKIENRRKSKKGTRGDDGKSECVSKATRWPSRNPILFLNKKKKIRRKEIRRVEGLFSLVEKSKHTT